MGRLLHGVLVLLVAADVLAGFLALLAPLALLVFVPPVAVALLAVMPPPAAAANGRRRRENTQKGQWRGGRREVGGEMQQRATGRARRDERGQKGGEENGERQDNQ